MLVGNSILKIKLPTSIKCIVEGALLVEGAIHWAKIFRNDYICTVGYFRFFSEQPPGLGLKDWNCLKRRDFLQETSNVFFFSTPKIKKKFQHC